jgi:hypothetical protein
LAAAAELQLRRPDRVILGREQLLAIPRAHWCPHVDKARHEDFSRIDAIPAFVDAYGFTVYDLFLSPERAKR